MPSRPCHCRPRCRACCSRAHSGAVGVPDLRPPLGAAAVPGHSLEAFAPLLLLHGFGLPLGLQLRPPHSLQAPGPSCMLAHCAESTFHIWRGRSPSPDSVMTGPTPTGHADTCRAAQCMRAKLHTHQHAACARVQARTDLRWGAGRGHISFGRWVERAGGLVVPQLPAQATPLGLA